MPIMKKKGYSETAEKCLATAFTYLTTKYIFIHKSTNKMLFIAFTRAVFSFPEPTRPYNRDTNKKNARQNLTRGLRPE